MKKTFTIAVLTISFLLSSCGSGKVISGSATANSSLATKNIIASHQQAAPNFKTLASKVQLEHDDGKKSQSITASLRIEKDKKIWVKASVLGITLAKVMITPTKVSYYESLGKTYFDGDFSLLSEWLGTRINFEQAQAILLGQSIFNLNEGYVSSVEGNKYKLLPKRQPNDFMMLLFLEPKNFKVVSESISQPSENRVLTVNYPLYQEIDGAVFPSEIKIRASENDDQTQVNLRYKNIDLNVSVNFPFTIPDGYTEIRL